jgi:hypothetical protein
MHVNIFDLRDGVFPCSDTHPSCQSRSTILASVLTCCFTHFYTTISRTRQLLKSQLGSATFTYAPLELTCSAFRSRALCDSSVKPGRSLKTQTEDPCVDITMTAKHSTSFRRLACAPGLPRGAGLLGLCCCLRGLIQLIVYRLPLAGAVQSMIQ